MTAIYPESRRAFKADEDSPARPLLSGAVRALMDWENYTYNSDLPITPSDAAIYGASEFLPWQADGASNSSPSPQRTASSSQTRRELTGVALPPPRIPTSGVKVWAWVELGATDSVGTLEVTNERNQVVYSSDITYAACGSVLTGAWIGVDAEAQPWDRLFVAATWTSGGSVTVAGLSGYWKAATLWDHGAFSAISQAHVVADRPAHAAVLRWLMCSANRFQSERAPLQFLSAYYEKWACGNLTDWVSSRVTLGRYKFLVGEKVTSLRVAIYAKSSGTATVIVKVDGTTKHTFTVASGTYAWQEASITITGASAATVADVALEWGQESSTYVMVPSVSIWEETSTLTLPGSETVPVSFAPNDNGAIGSGAAATATQWATLVANMVWLWKNRGLRALVCDSRWTACVTTADHHAPDSDYAVQGLWKFHFADAAGVPRFLSHYHGSYANWLSSSPEFHNTWAWVDEVAHKADAATATRSQYMADSEAVAITPEFLAGLDVVYADASPPWVTATDQTQEYRAWQQFDGGATSTSGTRICGMVIEQMPKNQTAGTRY